MLYPPPPKSSQTLQRNRKYQIKNTVGKFKTFVTCVRTSAIFARLVLLLSRHKVGKSLNLFKYRGVYLIFVKHEFLKNTLNMSYILNIAIINIHLLGKYT